MGINITLDSVARNMAFELALGGDRFGPEDIQEMLGNFSLGELNLLRNRVIYHAVDFDPVGVSDGFIGRAFDSWGLSPTCPEPSRLGKDYLELSERKDRGLWFRFNDGSLRKCRKAVREAMWGSGVLSGLSSPDPLSPIGAAKVMAGGLIDRYGERINLDGPCDSAEVLSYSTDTGCSMSVRRIVDDLTPPADRLFYVTYKTPNGRVSTLFDALEEDEAGRLADSLAYEAEYRLSPDMSLAGPFGEESRKDLPRPVAVTTSVGDRYMVEAFLVDRESGNVSLLARPEDIREGRLMSLPLSSLSDSSVGNLWSASRLLDLKVDEVLGPAVGKVTRKRPAARSKGLSL